MSAVPCPTRDYFPGCGTPFTLPRYVPALGPHTPTPNRTAVEIVAAVLDLDKGRRCRVCSAMHTAEYREAVNR